MVNGSPGFSSGYAKIFTPKNPPSPACLNGPQEKEVTTPVETLKQPVTNKVHQNGSTNTQQSRWTNEETTTDWCSEDHLVVYLSCGLEGHPEDSQDGLNWE